MGWPNDSNVQLRHFCYLVPAALLSTASLYLWRRHRQQQRAQLKVQSREATKAKKVNSTKADATTGQEIIRETNILKADANAPKCAANIKKADTNTTKAVADATTGQETGSTVTKAGITKADANITKADATRGKETSSSSITKEIDDIISEMVGLDGIKLQLKKWVKGLILHKKRKSIGLKTGPRKALHMAFLGNPGTGKTMVARYLGRILRKLGLVSTDTVTEVQRTDLVGEYVGQTGIKTKKKIKEAKGGILFVDEAYRLVPDDKNKRDYGVEALEEIMAAMDCGDIVSIFAGYKAEMERVISANPGFSRRVSKFLYFDDYSHTDIAMILQSKMRSQKEDSFVYGFKLHPDCSVDAIAGLIREHTTEELLKEMNGGLVDPWLVNALECMDLRLDENCKDAEIMTTVTMEDLEEGLKFLSECQKGRATAHGHGSGPIPSMYI